MAVTLNNKPVILTAALADLYTCTATRGAIVRGIQVANINSTTSQTIQISLQQSDVDYYLVRFLVIPVGSAASVLTDPITLKNGDKIRGFISTGSTLQVHCIISLEEYT